MSEPKTKPTNVQVDEFLASVDNEQRREDAREVTNIMQEITGEPPVMWGSSIIGFGTYHYKYASGREGDWMRIGLSPRKANLTVYLMDGFDNYDKLLNKLGPHSTGKSCLYIKRLDEVDKDALKQLIKESYSKGTPMGASE